MQKFLARLAFVGTAGLWCSTASATLIDPNGWTAAGCDDSASCSVGNAVLDAGGKTFNEKTVAGQRGLGISGGRTNGEIDIGEHFNVTYLVNEIIELIQIVFIYNGPEFNDVAEVAQVTANGSTSFQLQVSGTAENTASWTGAGATVTSCGATASGGSGCFNIFNPFGNLAVSSLSLTALAGGAPISGSGTNESDFSVGQIRSTAVPEPGTLSLLGVGLLSLGWMRRRARS